MRRLIHNMLQTLKKDDGAHFSYNLGVSFVRLGAVILGAAFILLLVYFLNIPDFIMPRGDVTASVSDTRVTDQRRIRGRGIEYAINQYHVTFSCKTSGGTAVFVEQLVPEKQYWEYRDTGGESLSARLYASGRNGLYVSRKGWLGAQFEYNRAHREPLVLPIAFWTFIASVSVIGFGLNQERLGMKYPRTDVELSENAIVSAEDQAYTDELLKEFDEAFEKFQANKAAGLPTSEPPRRKKSADEPLRLEKHDDDNEDIPEPETK